MLDNSEQFLLFKRATPVFSLWFL